MSKIDQIEVSRHLVINLGNYETAKFGVSMTISLDDGDDPDVEYHDLVDRIEACLQEDMDAFTN